MSMHHYRDMKADMEVELHVFRIDETMVSLLHDMSDEDLRSLAKSVENPKGDEEIEFFIYICYYIFQKTQAIQHVELAIQKAKMWTAAINADHPDHDRRRQILALLTSKRNRIHRRLLGDVQKLVARLDSTSQPMPKDVQLLLTKAYSLSQDVLPLLVDPFSIFEDLIPLLVRVKLRLESYLSGNISSASEQASLIAAAAEELDRHILSIEDMADRMARESERTQDVRLMHGSIRLMERARAMIPEGNMRRQVEVLANLGATLAIRSIRTDSEADLDRAIELTTMAMEATPENDPNLPNQSTRWNNLGEMLARRFMRKGSRADLDRAVQACSIAVQDHQHAEYAGYLDNLGKRLWQRFQLAGSMADLNRALDATSSAAEATPQDHDKWAARLSNYGVVLATRYDRTRISEHLDQSIEVISMVAKEISQDNPYRAACLHNKATQLGDRFQRTRVSADLDRAIEAATEAVESTPNDDSDRPGRLSTLGILLHSRFEQTGSSDEIALDEAIQAATKAVEATPLNHPDRASRLYNLGRHIVSRLERSYSFDDYERILAYSLEGWCCDGAPPSVRIALASRAAVLLSTEDGWDAANTLLREAIDLLPSVSPRTLADTDKQHMLKAVGSLGPDAAAVALNVGEPERDALKLLELGRGIIAGLLVEMRGDISTLRQQYPELAEEFVRLRDELDPAHVTVAAAMENPQQAGPRSSLRSSTAGVSSSEAQLSEELPGTLLGSAAKNTPSWELQSRRRREAEDQFDQLLSTIRSKPDFDDFLRPLSEDKLKAAADQGPIAIINVSVFRCDAFLVERNRPSLIRVLPLSDFGLTLDSVTKHAQRLRLARLSSSSRAMMATLEWLWDTVARPCLDALGLDKPVLDSDGARWPHVWWIPTGPLSQLPLHAAGCYGASRDTVLDRVMSSYALSVKTLQFGRQDRAPADGTTEKPLADDALLVAMEETPGLPTTHTLKFASKEVEMLKAAAPGLHLKAVTPACRKPDVVHHLESCRLFHFAGHGHSDPSEPSRSCLLLEDWKDNPLTAGDLRDCKFQENPPFLAFLSACSTGAATRGKIENEGVHLVSAFQLAGFRHVVGTLWEVLDEHCVDVARVFYETIRDKGMSDRAVCEGLHWAVRALRDRNGWAKGTRGEVDLADEANGREDAAAVAAATDGDNEVSLPILGGRDPNQVRRKRPQNMSWVPYIHFGV